jgi:hypothetical protein
MICVLPVFLLFVSCTTSCNKSSGLERTKTDKWERRNYPKLGISVEMPKAVDVLRIVDTDPSNMYGKVVFLFFIHPEYYGYVEPHYVISLDIEIFNKGQYERYISRGGNYLPAPFNDATFHNELKEDFHPDRTPSNEHYYRRDFRNTETGDAVLATAIYWKIIDPNHEEEDVATIRRILNSVQFIAKEEPKQNPDKTANDTENKK